ncbi:MAG: arginine--tRNA ligase, partial [Burkholderiales bacterium]
GHLRSTVIGDAIARICEYLGHTVIRQNHVGDWGTQFGMLIANLLDTSNEETYPSKLGDLETFYREAKERFDSDPEFATRARNIVVMLQSNSGRHAETIKHYWHKFNQVSLSHCQEVYDKLAVKLTNADVRGESAYNSELTKVIQRLEAQHLLVESEGAKCVFFAPGELPGGEETPFIVQKQDGGFLYSTTDLAALDYRVHSLNADRVIYVVDARQSFHFNQLFAVGKKAGFAKADTKLEHSAFGTMMNEDGRPFKTRDGGTVKLIDLIEEAISRAYRVITARNPQWSETDKQELANILAIGAIKYADLSKNRISDYIFSFDKMLAFEGNTAPYLLYAYTRVQSIMKKAEGVNVKVTA